MRRHFALAAAAIMVAGAGGTARGAESAADNAAMAQFCKSARLPSSIALCSDPELRALAIERQHAYDAAASLLAPGPRKALLADQNAWVRDYARACGVGATAPALPLAPEIRDCMEAAGRARVAYLKTYAAPPAAIDAPVEAAAAAPESPPAVAAPDTPDAASAGPQPSKPAEPLPQSLAALAARAAADDAPPGTSLRVVVAAGRDILLALNYPDDRAVYPLIGEIDAREITKALLGLLTSNGHKPTEEGIKIGVEAFHARKGETGTEQFDPVAEATYDPETDRIDTDPKIPLTAVAETLNNARHGTAEGIIAIETAAEFRLDIQLDPMRFLSALVEKMRIQPLPVQAAMAHAFGIYE